MESANQEETPKEVSLEINSKYNPTYHRLSDYVGVDKHERGDSETVRKMSFIYDWTGKRSKSKDTSGVIGYLAKVIKDSGVSFRGKTLVDYLYQNMRLSNDGDRLKAKEEKERKRSIREQKRRERAIKTEAKKQLRKKMSAKFRQEIKEALSNVGKKYV